MTFSSLWAAKGEAFAAEVNSKLAETGVAETGPEFEQNNPAPLVELEACYHLEFCYHHQLSLIDVCYFHLLPVQMEICYCYFHLLPLQVEVCYCYFHLLPLQMEVVCYCYFHLPPLQVNPPPHPPLHRH